jgi:hypothetical protein
MRRAARSLRRDGVKRLEFRFSNRSKKMAKAKAKAKGKAAPAAAPPQTLLVASKVRDMIKDAGCNTAGDALDGLNSYIVWLVVQATKRATQNGRKTVRAHDFIAM